MSWQPGDVSVDARRAAEAAAEAAGVPLKDWFAETVRAAIIRELGSLPPEEEAPPPQPTLELRVPESRPEPLVQRSTATARPLERAQALLASGPTVAEASPDPPPIAIAPDPPAPEPILAADPPPSPPIAEPEPVAPAPILAADPPTAPPIAEPEPPPAPITTAAAPALPVEPALRLAPQDARTADPRSRPVSLGVERLADSGLSSWLATRIQGLSTPPARGEPSIAKSPPRAISPPPIPPDRGPAPPAPAPLPPAPVVPAVPPSPAVTRSMSGGAPQQMVLPLSLPSGPVATLPLASLRPARLRARKPSDVDSAVAMLAGSVASQGVREPILVRRLAEKADQYEVVAGERRRLAAERGGRAELPAVIVTADDAEALTLSLAENLGRGDFSPLDEARTYLRLLTEYRVSPGVLAQRLARERSHIALALRLLGLPPKVRQLVDAGRLAPAQAYALLGAPDPEAMADHMIQAATSGSARDSA